MRSFHFTRTQYIVLLTAILVFLLTVLGTEGYLLQHTDHVLSLPGDDSFLNLAISKSLAFTRVWGISKYEFAARTTSLLFPALLAVGFFIFGAHILLVLVINVCMGILLLVLLQQWLVRLEIRPIQQLLILVAVILLTPLSLIVVAGREGILALLLSVLFLTRLYSDWREHRLPHQVYLYGALLVATQYAGILIIAAACGLLLIKRRGIEAGRLALWSLLPVLGFGLLSVSKHGAFIPGSLFMPATLLYLNYCWLVGVMVGFGVPLMMQKGIPRVNDLAARTTATGIGLLIFSALLAGGIQAFRETGRACIETYRQQWPEAKFASRYYNKWPLAVGNIGVVSYLTEGPKLDLSQTVNSYLPDTLRRLIQEKNIRIAFISRNCGTRPPEGWNKVASWKMQEKYNGTDEELSFYAVDKALASELRRNLREYQFFLPESIAVKYY